MNLVTIPLRNLRRKLSRTFMLATVFSVGIVSVVALNYLSEAVGEALEKKLATYGANILITPKAEQLSIRYGGLQLGDVSFDVKYLDEDGAVSAIRSIDLAERISSVAPKLALLTEVNEVPVGVVGVDWPQELAIKSYWGIEGRMPEADAQRELLAGSVAAGKLGLLPGSMVDLDGERFSVVGVLMPTGSEDDEVLFTSISSLQALTNHPGKAHFIEVSALCAGCPIDDIVKQLRAALPGVEIRAMQQVVHRRMATMSFVKRMALAVSGVILLTACFMIGLSIFSAVNERKKEIGLLRAVGFGRGAVFAVFCLEAVFVGVVAAVVGSLGGYGLALQLLEVLDVADGAQIRFELAHLGITFAGVLVLSVAASVFPAYKATRVEPSQALVML